MVNSTACAFTKCQYSTILFSTGTPSRLFEIVGVARVTYGPIAVPRSGGVIHNGATVTLQNANDLGISFHSVSTYLTST